MLYSLNPFIICVIIGATCQSAYIQNHNKKSSQRIYNKYLFFHLLYSPMSTVMTAQCTYKTMKRKLIFHLSFVDGRAEGGKDDSECGEGKDA